MTSYCPPPTTTKQYPPKPIIGSPTGPAMRHTRHDNRNASIIRPGYLSQTSIFLMLSGGTNPAIRQSCFRIFMHCCRSRTPGSLSSVARVDSEVLP